jgi:hypothetical protein
MHAIKKERLKLSFDELWRRIFWLTNTDVSEEPAVSLLNVAESLTFSNLKIETADSFVTLRPVN